MKTSLHTLFLILVVGLWIPQSTHSQTLPKGISQAFKEGNADKLASYFNESVEIILLDSDKIYKKNQAKLVMKNFFAANRPISFEEKHGGGPKDSQFSIGELKTSKKSFRIYLLLKEVQSKYLIHQLRIEKPND